MLVSYELHVAPNYEYEDAVTATVDGRSHDMQSTGIVLTDSKRHKLQSYHYSWNVELPFFADTISFACVCVCVWGGRRLATQWRG
jgi:hypothetical protein